MRILQITSASSFGGGERYVADLSNSLAARGHEVFAAVRPSSSVLNHLQIPASNIKTLPLRNALDASSARQLAQFIKHHKIEIVHAHMARDYSLAAFATRKKPNVKFFVTRHVLFPLSAIHRRTLASAASVIAVSGAVARQLNSQHFIDGAHIALIPNGIDLNRFHRGHETFERSQYLRALGLPKDCLLVGSIGELRALKRHDDFIRAAAIVANNIPESQFLVAGVDTSATAETRKELEQLIYTLGLENRVQLLGWLDHAEHLLLALDLFVSASETESFGLAIAEAMAAETAVVATATEGAREVVEDGKSGFLVPIGDVQKMAKAIITLLRDGDRRKAMGARGRELIREKFSLERMVDQIEELYHR